MKKGPHNPKLLETEKDSRSFKFERNRKLYLNVRNDGEKGKSPGAFFFKVKIKGTTTKEVRKRTKDYKSGAK